MATIEPSVQYAEPTTVPFVHATVVESQPLASSAAKVPDKALLHQSASLSTQSVAAYFGEGVVMTQLTSQCCRCCCCQPNIDWKLAVWADDIMTLSQSPTGAGDAVKERPPLAHVAEDADSCGRTCSVCMPGFRATKYTVHEGGDTSGQVLLTHSKGCTNGVSTLVWWGDSGPVRIPCCCNLPYLETFDHTGRVLGRSEYVCDACLFVPKYAVRDATGNLVYSVRPDTCCGGLCVLCKCGGKGAKCCRVPFYFRTPERVKIDGGRAQFVDLWAGWKAECCTKRDIYSIRFPADATPEQKLTLLGLAHLIDLTVIEQDQG